ncbi:hypothetical protein [Pedobacter sp.]
MEHILLRGSSNRKIIFPVPSISFYYDEINGYWLSRENGNLLVFDATFPGIGSKKRDLETGEDQK